MAMKLGKKLLKNLLIPCVVLPLTTTTFSCSLGGDENGKISFDASRVLTKTHSAQIIGNAINISSTIVHVEITASTSPWLILNHKEIEVRDEHFVIDFNIDASVDQNATFTFNLNVYYTDQDGNPKVASFTNFVIFYDNDIEYHEDRVTIENRTVEKTNSHIFAFKVDFYQIPKSDIIVSLENEDTGLLYIEKTVYTPGGLLPPELVIPINLNLGSFETHAFPFDLSLSFTNSYGIKQTTVFGGCVASYIDGKPETIPEEYYDIVHEEKNGDSQYILKGIKKGVNPLETNRYICMEIPSNVTDISPDAFANPEWFKSIRKLNIPRYVHTVGRNAFVGLKTLIEIDISSYQGMTPEWVTTCSQQQTKVFDTADLKGGYIWTNKAEDTDIYQQMFTNMGTQSEWKAFNLSSIIPDKAYALSEDKTNLLGINDDAIENLKNYQVIVIPSTVTHIEKGAFDELITHPFEKVTKSGVQLLTRRLIISKGVQSIPNQLFADCGIGGSIIMYSQHINEISKSAFENCCQYGPTGIPGVQSEKAVINFVECNDLTSIRDFAFNKAYLEQDKFVLPNNVNYIGQFAFNTNHFKSIVFCGHEETIGKYAFADAYSYPQSKTINEIDLSHFIYPIEGKDPETYIPDWFVQYDFAFEGAAQDTGTVWLSQQVYDEIGKDDRTKWENNFKEYHALPSGWTFSVK